MCSIPSNNSLLLTGEIGQKLYFIYGISYIANNENSSYFGLWVPLCIMPGQFVKWTDYIYIGRNIHIYYKIARELFTG